MPSHQASTGKAVYSREAFSQKTQANAWTNAEQCGCVCTCKWLCIIQALWYQKQPPCESYFDQGTKTLSHLGMS